MAFRGFMEMMPSPASLLGLYASMSTSIMLLRTLFDQLFPRPLQRYILNFIRSYWKPKSSKLTLLFEEKDDMTNNHMFIVAEAVLCSRINPDSNCLRITKNVKEDHINIKFAESEKIVDSYKGIPVTWKYVREEAKNNRGEGFSPEKKYMELKFEKKYKEIIIDSYLPSVEKIYYELENQKKVLKLQNLSDEHGRGSKNTVNLNHPSTFDTLAMDPKLKKEIMDDLDLFLSRRDFYKRVGKAWKRGYLLYGPPGTGKSSMIAAMANYLKFDVYDLQLMNVRSDSGLKELLLKTSNRSILVIEDIDCSIELPDRKASSPVGYHHLNSYKDPKFSLSGLLNFIDGLWSCCGDERIIIFTTNHKERLDPALLRPGRMDKHIHMSYLTIEGFPTLVANYLNIHDNNHWRFKEINELIKCNKVTPAQVAEELMKSDDVEVVLEGLVTFLKRKKMEADEAKDGFDNGLDEANKDKAI